MKRGKARRLELGGGSGITLCDSCLRKEIKWRKMRNMKLDPRAKFRVNYKIPLKKPKRRKKKEKYLMSFKL